MKNSSHYTSHKKQTTRPIRAQKGSLIPLKFRFFMLVYSGLWHLLKPVLKRHRRLKHGFEQRLVPDQWARVPLPRATKTLWMQASSGGEALVAESILSALEQLCAQQQENPMVITPDTTQKQGESLSATPDAKQHSHEQKEKTSTTHTPLLTRKNATYNPETLDSHKAHTAKAYAFKGITSQETYVSESHASHKAHSSHKVSSSYEEHSPESHASPLQGVYSKKPPPDKHLDDHLHLHKNTSLHGVASKNSSNNTSGYTQNAAETNTPFIDIICTTCTLQGLEVLNKVASKNLSSYIRIIPTYFPLDMPHLMQKALDTLRPDAIVLLETELWPALLFCASKKDIPLLIANGRMTEKSVSAYRFLRGFLSRFSPQWVMATSEENAQRFKQVFPHAFVEEVSNCKFDIAKKLLEKKGLVDIPQPHAIAGHTTNKRTVLLASVREEEEKVLLQTVLSLVDPKNTEKKPLVVIAPRHLHRAKAWMEMLTRHQIPSVFRSAFSPSPQKVSKSQVIIWDAFGELSSLYASCDAIFVGGSFAPVGGQNFLEPMAFGKRPFVGPYLDNFLWIGTSVMQAKLAIQLATPEELAPALLQAAEENNIREQKATQKHFSSWLLPRTGGSTAIAKKILNIIDADF